MGKDVIFKTFRTYAHPYVYDRHTNSLVMLSSDDEFAELRDVETGKLPWEQSAVVHKYQSVGLMQPNVVEQIEHPATDIVEQYLKTRIRQITLQVTQQCNLRCEYCIYSGKYNNARTHSTKKMSLDTAKKAIDFFLRRNRELSDVIIGFYGGEPLLEFDLIKACVEYAESRVEGKRINYTITTNGTLLSDKIVDFLVENNFSLAISLDGSKEEHDASRKFANGKGSFDTIIANIQRLQARYPEYAKNIRFLTTVNPYMNLGCTLEYFSASEIFSDNQIIFNSMNETNLSERVDYDKRYYQIRNYEYMKLLFSLANKLDSQYISPLVARAREEFFRLAEGLRYHTPISPKIHHNGPCLPGVMRLFVRVDGRLFPCERVNENLEYFQIGTLEDGINIDRVRQILNVGKITEDECKNCWNIRQCSICSSQLEFETEPTHATKISSCQSSCMNTLFHFNELCILREFGFDIEEGRIV